MMSSIGSIGSSMMTGLQSMPPGGGQRRPDPAAMAEKLFAKLDTDSQGYIESSDLQTALSQIDSTSSSSELFNQLDGDGDGKVTQDEFTSAFKTIAQQLDSQFDQMRMGGMPPPPPPPNDSGFTQEELESQLEEIGSSGGRHAELMSNIVENFDAADTDGDGKVSFKEAMAYDQSSRTSNSEEATASANNDGARLMMQIMKLVEAYGLNQPDSAAATLSESA